MVLSFITVVWKNMCYFLIPSYLYARIFEKLVKEKEAKIAPKVLKFDWSGVRGAEVRGSEVRGSEVRGTGIRGSEEQGIRGQGNRKDR